MKFTYFEFLNEILINLIQESSHGIVANPIYPTPPLRQDMTQGQFLSGV